MVTQINTKRSLQEKLDLSVVLSRSRDDDRLMLDDQILLAALDGSRPLSAEERDALQKSPITLLRFRHLALQARARKNGQAANDEQWQVSKGMLRAAASGGADGKAQGKSRRAGAVEEVSLFSVRSDDHYWKLDFIPDDDGWQFILTLDVNAPFSSQIMQESIWLRVMDGANGLLLEGQLDADGECEVRWPHDTDPAIHLQQNGAMFRIELARPV